MGQNPTRSYNLQQAKEPTNKPGSQTQRSNTQRGPGFYEEESKEVDVSQKIKLQDSSKITKIP